jgi:hypothetical protein
MSLRQPASGRRVGAGTLRVDAARAIAKLRDYQLSEPTAWVLEGIRAAVASGATRVELQGDSNDIWLSWQGEAWPAEKLPTLLDELVSPASARDGQKLRLLGTAINSALGLRPAYIDVYRISEGKAEKVRYMASLLEEVEGEASELARPELEEVEVPSRAGEAAMFIHFRRRFGMDPIRNLFHGQPPEMPLARAACGDLPIPIQIADEEFGAHRNQSDLLRVEIGHDIDGFLALVNPWYAHPSRYAQMHVAEHGVRIASYAIDLKNDILLAPLPLRLFIDAERMPTNASRSEVRRTAHPINTAERQIPQLFEKLCEALVAELGPEARTEPARHTSLREAALTLLAASIAGKGWSMRARQLHEPLKGLAKLRLLHNAVGGARAVDDYWDEEAIHTGREALAADMRRWFGATLWLAPGDAAQVIAPKEVDAGVLRRRLRSARRELRARRRFESHAPRAARFERVPASSLRVAIGPAKCATCTRPAPPDLEGEICLLSAGRSALMTVLIEGREIDEVELSSPLPFRALVTSPRLSPSSDYRSVARNSYFDTLLEDVLGAVIRCVEELSLEGSQGFAERLGASPEEARALVRGALEAAHRSKLDVEASPLIDYPAWELDDGAASLTELRKYRAVACVPSRRGSCAPPGRIVVVSSKLVDRELLRALLESHETQLVYYDPNRLTLHPGARARAQSPRNSPRLSNMAGLALARSLANTIADVAAVAVEEEDCRGAIAWGPMGSEFHIYHRGVRLSTEKMGSPIPGATLAVDGDAVIPKENWRGVHDKAGLDLRDYRSWQTKLVRSFALALIGRAPEEFIYTGSEPSLYEGPGRSFVATLMHVEDVVEPLGEAYEALRAAPIFEQLGGERVSADDLDAAFPQTVDYLEAVPLGATPEEDWQPLVASETVAKLVGRLIEKPVREASAELRRRRAERRRRAQLAAHREQAPVVQSDLVADSPRVIEFRSEFAHGLVGMGSGLSPSTIDVHILLEERPLLRSQARMLIPISAAL